MRGFSLIEFIIYIGIISIMLVATTTFTWTLISSQIKQTALTEVNAGGEFVLDKITYHGQRASAINSATIYNAHPGKLIFDFTNNPQITIDTYQKEITLGDTLVNITKLQLTEGVNPAIDITSDSIDVANFVITDLSNSNATTLQIELNLEAVNPSRSKAYEAQNSWTTSFTLRKK